jgi:predicted sugar kinase
MAYYDVLVKQLAEAVKRKQQSLPAANIGGYIVDCGWEEESVFTKAYIQKYK